MTDVLLTDGVESSVQLANPETQRNQSHVSVQLLQELPESVQEKVKSQDLLISKLLKSGRRLRKPSVWAIAAAQDEHRGTSGAAQTDPHAFVVDLGPNELRQALVRVSPRPEPDDFYALVVRQEVRSHGDLHAGHVVVVVPGHTG
jgi:hypothetical protein